MMAMMIIKTMVLVMTLINDDDDDSDDDDTDYDVDGDDYGNDVDFGAWRVGKQGEIMTIRVGTAKAAGSRMLICGDRPT